MVLPFDVGSLEVVGRTGLIVGHGYVWRNNGDILHEWRFLPEFEWPPLGIVEFRAAAQPFASIEAWRTAARAAWTVKSIYVRAKVQMLEPIYPDPWRELCSAILCENRFSGVAFADIQTSTEALAAVSGSGDVESGKILFSAKEVWYTDQSFKPAPQCPVRLVPYSTDTFGPLGSTRQQVVEKIASSGQYSRNMLNVVAYSTLPF
ncbi:MAG: hypothetical protein IPK82_22845 [Polyangiaceae bacterium]|nr:hypothetical protein [Polyangiaceae bacterium]